MFQKNGGSSHPCSMIERWVRSTQLDTQSPITDHINRHFNSSWTTSVAWKVNITRIFLGYFITLSNVCIHFSIDSIVKTTENCTMGEKRSKFKRIGSVNLCTLCDTSKKHVICVSEEMKLQAITLKGGHGDRKGMRGTSLQLENTFTLLLYLGTILNDLHVTSGFLFYNTLNNFFLWVVFFVKVCQNHHS